MHLGHVMIRFSCLTLLLDFEDQLILYYYHLLFLYLSCFPKSQYFQHSSITRVSSQSQHLLLIRSCERIVVAKTQLKNHFFPATFLDFSLILSQFMYDSSSSNPEIFKCQSSPLLFTILIYLEFAFTLIKMFTILQ